MRRIRLLPLLCLAAGTGGAVAPPAPLAAPETSRGALRLLLEGSYEKAISQVAAESAAGADAPEEAEAGIRAQLALGRHAEAQRAVTDALAKYSDNLSLHWLAREVALANGNPGAAALQVEEIRRRYSLRPWSYRDAPSLVAFGRAALVLGADPKEVLDKLYSAAGKLAPQDRTVFLARGELALAKHDFALAAKVFGEGLRLHPDDADLNGGLAQAHAEGDRKAMVAAAEAALHANPRHGPTLVLLAEQKVDEEDYAGAEDLLRGIIALNPVQPDAWALRAVLALLQNDAAGATRARTRGWPRGAPTRGWISSSGKSSRKNTVLPAPPSTSGRPCGSRPTTCPRRPNSPATSSGWAMKPRGGNWPRTSAPATSTTCRPTTSPRCTTRWRSMRRSGTTTSCCG